MTNKLILNDGAPMDFVRYFEGCRVYSLFVSVEVPRVHLVLFVGPRSCAGNLRCLSRCSGRSVLR